MLKIVVRGDKNTNKVIFTCPFMQVPTKGFSYDFKNE